MKESVCITDAREMAEILSPLAEKPVSEDTKKYLKGLLTGIVIGRGLEALKAENEAENDEHDKAS